MRNLYTYRIVAFMIILGLSFTFSCKKDNQIRKNIYDSESINEFKKNFPLEFNMMDRDDITEVNPSNIDPAAPDIDFLLFKIDIKGKESYYVEFNDKGYFLDYSAEINGVKAFCVDNPNEYMFIPYENKYNKIPKFEAEVLKFETIEKSTSNTEGIRYILCIGGCTGVALAIAGTDGPAPFMDILAIAYQLDCGLACADKWL